MVLLTQGLSIIAEFVKDSATKGQCGSDDTQEDISQTGLISPITASFLDLNATLSSNVIRFEYSAPAGVGTGEDFTEFSIKKTDGTAINRRTFGNILKDSNVEISIINTWRFKQ